MASATVNIGDEEMVVVSVYCHRDDPAVSADLEEVALHCKNNRLPLIIGADSNSWSPLWGPLQNDRGKVFEEFINEFDLRVLNDSNSPPTFISTADGGKTRTWIDITLINTYADRKDLGKNWQVRTKAEVFSDHRLVTFDAKAAPNPLG